jgi:hypothetical protein
MASDLSEAQCSAALLSGRPQGFADRKTDF